MRNLPWEGANPNLIIALYFAFKSLPILVSGLAIYLGYLLFRAGVTGQASIVVNAKGLEGQLLNAAPGLVFSVAGLVTLGVAVWKGVEVEMGQQGTNEDAGEYERRLVVNQRVDPEDK